MESVELEGSAGSAGSVESQVQGVGGIGIVRYACFVQMCVL